MQNYTKGLLRWLILSKSITSQHLIWLRCVLWPKFNWKLVNGHYINVWVTTNEPLKMLPCHFRFFHFFNFNMNFVKNVMKKVSILRRIFKVCLKFFYVTQIFTISKFLTLKWQPFKYFLKSARKLFPLLNIWFFIFVQYASKGIWSLEIRSAYSDCLQNMDRWKWIFAILVISVFHFNITFVESLMKKIPFLRWIFKVDSEIAALKIFIEICAKVLFLCLLFLDLRNMAYFFPRSVQHVWVFGYCKLRLRNKLIVCKIQAVENGFSLFSVILFFSL